MPSGGNSSPPTKINGGKYELEKKIGAGCFGEVWRGHETDPPGNSVAVKFEDLEGHAQQLEQEVEVLRSLFSPTAPQGFTQCFHSGREGRFHCMVIECLGKSLEERLQQTTGQFNLQTTILIADQVLRRIEYLHSRGYIHRDIKPENFMFGVKDKIHHLYLIDFGLSKRYYDGKHVPLRMKLSLTGTARYASINAHKGVEQSRRDDLEAIGHMLIYFLRGSLPWSGLEAKTQEEKYRKICEKKMEVPLATLCAGFPDAFQNFLKIARGMEFKERPKYDELRKLFTDVKSTLGHVDDHQFQWFDGKDLGNLTPLLPAGGLVIRQPDDKVARRRFPAFWCCGSDKAVKD